MEHLHSGINFVTPNDKHLGNDKIILTKRRQVYESARRSNPLRWSKNIRKWTEVKEIRLNNLKKEEIKDTKLAA